MAERGRATDARAARSRRALHAALVELTLARGWDRVSVQAVCARAGVARSTFYFHFADKEELLIGGLDLVAAELRGQRRSGARRFPFLVGLFEHVASSRRLFHAIIGKHSGLAAQRKFRAIAAALCADEVVACGVPVARRAVTARFLSGALVELLLWWLTEAPDLGAAELRARYLALATPVLAAAGQR